MPECIVCKGYYEKDHPCQRCGSDNTPWDDWQERVEEQGGLEGLLAFFRPHFYLPLFVTLSALPFGLMGIGGLWKGITPASQLLAVVVTVCLCLIATLAGYSARHEIREQDLLNRVRRGYSTLLGGVRFRAIVVPAFSLLLVLLITYTMVTSDMVWKLAKWLFLDPVYLEQVERQEAMIDATTEGEQSQKADGLRTRIRQVLPFALMGMYVAFMVSFTYSVSLLLTLVYAQEMNKALPQPIFLQGNRLAEMVRMQAEQQLDREAGFVVRTTRTLDEGRGEVAGTMLGMFNRLLLPPGTPEREEERTAHLRRQQEQTIESENWNWEELERTDDGGITMKASGRQYVQASGNPASMDKHGGQRIIYTTPQMPSQRLDGGMDKHGGQRIIYTVLADPWGRIVRITRAVEEAST